MTYEIEARKYVLLKNSMPEPMSGCWLWLNHTDKDGYGQFKFEGASIGAHRESYRLFKGPLQKGLCICHTCDVTACVNPEHLYQGTYKRNSQDSVDRKRHWLVKKTHCLRGHEFTPENTKYFNKKTGKVKRKCRICARAASRALYHRLGRSDR